MVQILVKINFVWRVSIWREMWCSRGCHKVKEHWVSLGRVRLVSKFWAWMLPKCLRVLEVSIMSNSTQVSLEQLHLWLLLRTSSSCFTTKTPQQPTWLFFKTATQNGDFFSRPSPAQQCRSGMVPSSPDCAYPQWNVALIETSPQHSVPCYGWGLGTQTNRQPQKNKHSFPFTRWVQINLGIKGTARLMIFSIGTEHLEEDIPSGHRHH